jgi:hypothetical protein
MVYNEEMTNINGTVNLFSLYIHGIPSHTMRAFFEIFIITSDICFP